MFLHKDVDFRSPVLPDPIISREEYVFRNEHINKLNKEYKDGPVKPALIIGDDEQPYVELSYPWGEVVNVYAETEHGFITAVMIEQKQIDNEKCNGAS